MNRELMLRVADRIERAGPKVNMTNWCNCIAHYVLEEVFGDVRSCPSNPTGVYVPADHPALQYDQLRGSWQRPAPSVFIPKDGVWMMIQIDIAAARLLEMSGGGLFHRSGWPHEYTAMASIHGDAVAAAAYLRELAGPDPVVVEPVKEEEPELVTV